MQEACRGSRRYCGSGTTLEAAALLGRRFIGIDIADAAIAATVKRFCEGRSAMGDFVGARRKTKPKTSDPMLFSIDE